MRNVFATLKRHRHVTLLSQTLRHDRNMETIIPKCIPLRCHKYVEIRWKQDNWFPYHWFPYQLLQRHCISTSVHGERPTAEYAKLRKESLETQFRHALGAYGSKSPFLALYRAAIVSFYVLKLTIWQCFVHDIKKRAVKFRQTLIHLGPFYIKLGQALSTRPDILPTVYCQELVKLQDQIPPFPTRFAIKSIESQLGGPISQLFADISPEPVAAASLGQVYKAHLHSGELVAVKVQRPGMSLALTLDALLFHMIGGQLKRFAKARKDLLVAVNEMVRHMFDEIDYIQEAKNADRFASLYASRPSDGQKGDSKPTARRTLKHKEANTIKVPKIYWDLTCKGVLTMEWIDGIKLTDDVGLKMAGLNRKKLIDQGLYCSLRQLLEVGFFHADPHPGNLVATNSGALVYFDFGMMGEIPRHYRVGLIQVLVHFVNRDSLGLANDFLSLGFIPEGVDVQSVADALQASFSDRTRQSQDFQGIMDQLYDIMYEFNFSLPPDYALVIRALGSLEGTAKVLDPAFKVIESSYPFVIGRLLADPNPDMRRILRQLLIRNDGSIRWNRLERLIAAISEQASESAEEHPNSGESSPNPLRSKSFDMHAVVAATEDLLRFILSEKGQRVRVFLVRDIIHAADAFIQDEVVGCMFDEKPEARGSPESEGHDTLKRVVIGFRYLRQAVKLAPEVWTEMLVRMALTSEVHRFTLDILSSLIIHLKGKIPETTWVCISRLMHKMAKNRSSSEFREQAARIALCLYVSFSVPPIKPFPSINQSIKSHQTSIFKTSKTHNTQKKPKNSLMAPFLAPNLITIIMITIITTSPQLVLTHPNLIPPHLSQLDTWIVHNMRDYANRKATQVTLRFDSKLLSAEYAFKIITVKKDGTGDFKTVTDAVNSIPSWNKRRVVVFIGGGEYREKILVDVSRPFVTFYGDKNDVPSITFDGTALKYGTWDSATVTIEADYFVAVNIAFVNSAPMPDGKRPGAQAVAMRISGDKAAFHSCRFIGFQDTLCDDRGRHFFKDCYIQGTVDFIFGNGKSLYLNNRIHSVANGMGVITAHAREDAADDSGFAFVHCNITGTGDTFLGRAWRDRARVVFAYTYMGSLIDSQGWSDAKHSERDKTVYYGEYKCMGPGSSSTGRVKYAKMLSDEEAKPFLSMTFIRGTKWVLPPPKL